MTNRLIAFLFFCAATMAVMFAQTEQGLARDEIVYVRAGENYASWLTNATSSWEAFSKQRIEATFGKKLADAGNNEHPPLIKYGIGVSIALFHDALRICGKTTAARIPAALLFALLIVAVFFLAANLWQVRVGVGAAALTLVMPRLFFHAGFACFDVAVASFWILSVFFYWKMREDARFALLLGLSVGAALLTKHNGLILPPMLLGHHCLTLMLVSLSRKRFFIVSSVCVVGFLLVAKITSLPIAALCALVVTIGLTVWLGRPRRWSFSIPRWNPKMILVGGLCLGLLSLISPLFFIAAAFASLLWITVSFVSNNKHTNLLVLLGLAFAISTVMLFLFWPKLWHQPQHVADWISFHLKHVHYNFEVLGENLNHPPFSKLVTPAILWSTVPIALLLPAVFGLLVFVSRLSSPGYSLLLVSLFCSMVLFFFPNTPVFASDKHWLAALPVFAMAASLALCEVTKLVHWGVQAALVFLTFLAGAAEVWQARPLGLSHYMAQVGGPIGGATMGMNRQYWGYSALHAAPFLFQHPEITKVYGHDADMAFPLYAIDNRFPARVRHSGREKVGIAKSDAALVVHEKHFNRHDYLIWQDYGTFAPSEVITHLGVPVLSIYVRPNEKRR